MNHWNTEPDDTGALLLELHHDWGCFCQAGDKGIVFTKKGSYRTAFFEAFPRDPNTFIRGEGKDIIEAENDAWQQFEKIMACKQHEFERRGYRNGAGFCKHCDLFLSRAFEPLEICCIGGESTYFTSDIDDKWYCEKHAREKPLEKYTDIDWHIIYSENDLVNSNTK